MITESYQQTIPHTFPEFISSNTDITVNNTILRVSESYHHTLLTYLELISNYIHTFTELLPNSSKPFFESFNGQLNRQKILKEKIPKKFEKLASHMKQIILQSTTLEFTWSLMYVWLAPSSPPIIKMKRKLRPPIQKVAKKSEIFPAPCQLQDTYKNLASPPPPHHPPTHTHIHTHTH